MDLELIAKKARLLALESIYLAGSGHIGGSLGMSNILVNLYFNLLNINPENPKDKSSDRLILSNGHLAPILYATLALRGYFDVEELQTLRKINSRLQGHPNRLDLPGIEVSTGPLGQGVSVACGIALANKLDEKRLKVVCILGDGEHGEGQVWESIMFASKYSLNNLIIIVDRNYIQIDGNTEEVMPLGDLYSKYTQFGWNTKKINGNSFLELDEVFTSGLDENKPTAIIANTIPGFGVDFMENNFKWHGKPINKEEYELAKAQLEK